jgi:hypothetical protein
LIWLGGHHIWAKKRKGVSAFFYGMGSECFAMVLGMVHWDFAAFEVSEVFRCFDDTTSIDKGSFGYVA